MEGIYGRSVSERRIKHYSSTHDILLVGEGDFSFSLSLAIAFRRATNIVATSLDYLRYCAAPCFHYPNELLMKYQNARENLEMLGALGACLLHGVDATKMSFLHHIGWKKFHRIIFNFPHAGFLGKENNPDLIEKHRNLVRGFLRTASSILWPNSEIHVNHKVTPPFDSWNIQDLGAECSLLFIGADKFRAPDYFGYENKRGSGLKPDDPFPLGECRTFKFKLWPSFGGALNPQGALDLVYTLPKLPVDEQQQPPVALSKPSLPSPFVLDNVHSSNELTNECYKIFGVYLKHVEESFGDASYDVSLFVREALRLGLEAYRSAEPERPLSGYISILEVLHSLSMARSEQLRQMLLHS